MSFLCRNSIQIASPSSILCDIFCTVTGRVAYHGEDPALGRVHPPGRAPQPLKMPPHRFSTDTRKNLWLGDSPLFRPVASRGSRLHASRPTRGQGGLSRTPWLLAIVLLSFVAVPPLPRLDLASVALYHSRAVVRVHWQKSWSADTPCFDWRFHLQTYAGCFRPLVSSEKHLVALSIGTS